MFYAEALGACSRYAHSFCHSVATWDLAFIISDDFGVLHVLIDLVFSPRMSGFVYCLCSSRVPRILVDCFFLRHFS